MTNSLRARWNPDFKRLRNECIVGWQKVEKQRKESSLRG